MLEVFQYPFMQKALIVGALLGLIVPLIGVLMVSKRLSMIGDALSHMSLAGVSIGLIFNFNPILGALLTGIISALSIDYIRSRLPQHAETSIAVITSTGIGLAGLLSGLIPNAANFNSFLFGSIVAISNDELWLVVIIALVVFILFTLFYKEFFLVAMDEKNARLQGVNVKIVNLLSLFLTALTVSIAARTVGALIISSLMVIPVVSALQISKSYKQTVIFSVIFGFIFTVVGLISSFYLRLKPGGTIVIFGILVLFMLFIYNGIKRSKIRRRHL